MSNPKTVYTKILVALTVCFHVFYLSAQENKIDTLLLFNILTRSDAQLNLDYALLTAASEGDTTGIDWLVKYGANINASTPQNVTPIVFAVAADETDAVKHLLAYKPELDFLTGFNESPLIVAVKNQNPTITELLIRDSASVNFTDRNGYAPLHFAAIYGSLTVVDMLIYYDADVNIKSRDGTSPLMVSVSGGYGDISDLLIQNGADVNATDINGFTPLMIASQLDDTVLIDLLLKKGAKLKAVNRYSYDALDLAIRSNSKAAAGFLLRKGTGLAQPGAEATNPYLVAAAYANRGMIDILKENKVREIEMKGFDHITFGISEKTCILDFNTGFSLGTGSSYKRFDIYLGYDFKPVWSRVVIKENDHLYYQYMDRSSLVYAGAVKGFRINQESKDGIWLFDCSLAAGCSFGDKFKGTEKGPGTNFHVMPGVGLKYTKNTFNFNTTLEYTGTEFYRIGPVWLRVGIAYNMFFKNARGPLKIIRW